MNSLEWNCHRAALYTYGAAHETCLQVTSIQPTKGGAARPPGEFEGHSVVRRPQELSLHHALVELNWSDATGEIDDIARKQAQVPLEPILITSQNTILGGLGRWQLALLQGTPEVNCLEYSITEEAQLQFILAYHKPRRGWNAFVRIRLALTLEPTLQKRALVNMRHGGRHKGLANLPELSRIDVRKQIAEIAATGTRNVSNVKAILTIAHPRLIAALSDGTLTIHRAMQLCRLNPAEQLQQFIFQTEEAATNGVIRQCIAKRTSGSHVPDVSIALDLLQRYVAEQPSAVEVRPSQSQRSIILLGRDLIDRLLEGKAVP